MDVQEEAKNVQIRNKIREVDAGMEMEGNLILLGDFNAHLITIHWTTEVE